MGEVVVLGMFVVHVLCISPVDVLFRQVRLVINCLSIGIKIHRFLEPSRNGESPLNSLRKPSSSHSIRMPSCLHTQLKLTALTQIWLIRSSTICLTTKPLPVECRDWNGWRARRLTASYSSSNAIGLRWRRKVPPRCFTIFEGSSVRQQRYEWPLERNTNCHQ